ncbi:ATP-dependent helicase [Candidatus Uhrbacteria bacterium]|nr:ATP-dependent helicase [Candidatus Uhrbacteria bacterium]
MKEFVLQDDAASRPLKIDYGRELNPEQLDVVLNGDGPCLVLAGAGSGKTRTITYRVAYLLERGVSPEQILLVTFTNKAAKEMIHRVEALLSSSFQPLTSNFQLPNSGTFHSVANRLLRIYCTELGYTKNFTILDEEDAKSLVKACIQTLSVDTGERRFPSPGVLHAMASYARNSGQALRSVVENKYQNFYELIPTIERVVELYEVRKKEADSMDFDDLLLKLRELLFTRDDIRRRLAHQFQYVLVDEYQDTNVVQSEIVRQLSSEHGNVVVVGDDAQSIYSFRAAQIKNILGFPESHPGTKTFRLTTNYRSSPEILAVANASIQQNKEQFEKKLSAMRGSLGRPNLVPAESSAQEAQFIAQRILALRSEGMPLSEMAVLFRAAFHSQALEFELMKRDIPYEYRGGMKFFERAHVKDVIAHLRVRVNPHDEVAWMRILSLMNGIGLATAQKIVSQIRDASSLDEVVSRSLSIPSRAQTSWGILVNLLRKLSREEMGSDLIRVVTGGDYQDYLRAEYPDFMDRLEDLEQFAIFAEGYTSIQTLLDEVSLSADFGAVREDGSHDDEEKIVLSTIHQAKGLEWDAVFVMHLCDDKFPNPRALTEKGGLEEERRLFYVATTRARKHLFFTYPIVSGYDTLMLSQPSLFLQELPSGLLEEVRLKREFMSGVALENSDATIVLDSLGERAPNKDVSKMSFLRGVDEL